MPRGSKADDKRLLGQQTGKISPGGQIKSQSPETCCQDVQVEECGR
jgi:hypothetical protein